MTLAAMRAFVFPYRTHLEHEVEYLRGQVAQLLRRNVEMQEAINRVALRPKEAVERTPPPLVETPPRGFEAVRDYTRRHRAEEAAKVGEASVDPQRDSGVAVNSV